MMSLEIRLSAVRKFISIAVMLSIRYTVVGEYVRGDCWRYASALGISIRWAYRMGRPHSSCVPCAARPRMMKRLGHILWCVR